MQKKIIALAIAAAFSAPAFADTTVYGLVDAAVAHVSADGLKSDTLAVSGGLSTSRLGVKSVQDAGDMKVVAVLEYGLAAQTNSTVGTAEFTGSTAARQQMLALAGGFGTVATGFLQTTGYDFGVKFDPTAGSTVSPLGNVTKGGGFLIGTVAIAARAPRALAYISPDLGGVTVAVNYTTAFATSGVPLGNLGEASSATLDNKSTAYLLSATYNNGPLSVGGVYTGATLGDNYLQTVHAAVGAYTSTLSATEYALGASYDLTVVKLFATYQASKTGTNNIVTTASDNKAYSFSAVAPVGPGAIAFSYAKNKINATGTIATLSHQGAATGTDQAANGLTLAWLQGLSKTTTFYAAYTKMSEGANTHSYSVVNNSVAGGTAGGSSSMIAVGLQNKF